MSISSVNFARSDSTLESPNSLYLASRGYLTLGSESCRLQSKIEITFFGSLADSSTVDSTTGAPSKGLVSSGTTNMHGKLFFPTWTRLSQTASINSNNIYLQDKVNWEVGQEILLTTTVVFDCPPMWQAEYCLNQPHQNEQRTITAVSMNDITREYIITVNEPLNYGHHADNSYQGEGKFIIPS